MTLRRMWINQPSTLQPYHALHGRRVLTALDERTIRVWADGYDFIHMDFDRAVRVWFTEGDVVSMAIDPLALSDGWPHHLQPQETR